MVCKFKGKDCLLYHYHTHMCHSPQLSVQSQILPHFFPSSCVTPGILSSLLSMSLGYTQAFIISSIL